MQRGNFTRNRPVSRARFNGRPIHQNRRSGHRTPGGGTINISRFINKAPLQQQVEVFVPKHAFADFNIDARLKHNIAHKGYVAPMPIQDNAIPHILDGRDVVGLANTGTGKTGAFLIPLIDKALRIRETRVLIMVPTRELAVQIEEEFRGFSARLGMYSVCAVGGASINPQIALLRRNPSFVIGTPGRLKDLMERRALDLSRFQTVVLDEADRMLDMGFIADMRFILSHMSPVRHTLFFSATLSPEIERLIHQFLREPVTVSVRVGDTAKSVDQDVVHIAPGKTKVDHLKDLLCQPDFKKVLIFGRTKHGVERLSRTLNAMGFRAESIHGNKTHNNRQRALKLFKEERVGILVATDVAARGLDIPKVSHVINFDIPECYDDYVHRIGRTGRAGEMGKALTFIE